MRFAFSIRKKYKKIKTEVMGQIMRRSWAGKYMTGMIQTMCSAFSKKGRYGPNSLSEVHAARGKAWTTSGANWWRYDSFSRRLVRGVVDEATG